MTNKKYLYVVNTDTTHPLKKVEVVYESPSMYVLEDKTIVSKHTMGDAYHLYFVEPTIANTVLSYMKATVYPQKAIPNMQAIQNCKNATSMAIILFNMIQTLCEEGMPTHTDIEEWLRAPAVEDKKAPAYIDTYDLEEYDVMREGDTVFYIAGNKVLEGTIFGIRRNEKGRISSISIDAPDDFIGMSSELFGKQLFIRKYLAELFITP